MSRLRGLAVLALPIAAVTSPGTLAAQAVAEAGPPEVVSIAFEGNEAFPDDSLSIAIENRATECRSRLFFLFCLLGLDFADDRHLFQRSQFPEDAARIVRYYLLRGYRETEADTSSVLNEADNEIALTFRIEEGRPVLVDTILFLGDSLPAPSFLEDLPLRKGDPLSGLRIAATRDSLQSRLRNAGYARAEVLTGLFIPEGEYEGEVELDVFTGPLTRFGEIDVRWTGADHSLSRESVLRFLPFEEGDLYDRELILRAQRSLYAVELIQSAKIEEDTLAPLPDSVFQPIVTLSEGDVHRVRAGVGWSTSECVNGEARWTSRNFFGGARRLSVRGRLSNFLAESAGFGCAQSGSGDFAKLNWLASVEFSQPWIFSTRNSLSASLFGERTSLPDVFIREAVGLSLGLNRSLGQGARASLTYVPQLSRLRAAGVFFCTSFLVCEPRDIDVLSGANWLAPIGMSATLDRTDNFLNPSSGYRFVGEVEHAAGWTGSNFLYTRAVGEADYYHRLARRTVVAGRLRGGWIGGGRYRGPELESEVDVVHPQKRFYAGGANSVRGFALNRLGPRVLTTDVRNLVGFPSGTAPEPICAPEEILTLTCDPNGLDDDRFFPRPTGGTRLIEGNLEYRFAFGGDFQGVGFLDFGQVFREDSGLDFGALEFSPGVGVRWFTLIGPVRVDLAYRFRGGQELQVVTSQIRPFMAGDDPNQRICIVAPESFPVEGSDHCEGDLKPIEWIRLDDLAVLQPPALFGERRGFLRRLQLHFSIGQAF